MAAHLRETELDAEPDDVRNGDHRQHFEETEPERSPELGHDVLRKEVLVPDVVHAEQQCRHQRDDDHNHRTLHVVAVADMGTAARRGVRYEEERFESVECRLQEAQFAALGERRLDLIYQITNCTHRLSLPDH